MSRIHVGSPCSSTRPSVARGSAVGARIAALLGVFVLGGCGGGGSGGTLPGQFAKPVTALEVPPGGRFDVRVTGLVPGTSVLVTLDVDGDPATAGDAHALGAPLVADAAGEVDASVATDGAPAGAYRLLAVRAGSAETLARAGEHVTLSSRARFTWLASNAQEQLVMAGELAGGRLGLVGQHMGDATYATTAGSVTLPFHGSIDSFAGLLDGGDLVTVRPIAGSGVQNPEDFASAPGGGFSVVGSTASVPALGIPVTAPANLTLTLGFLVTYDAAGLPTNAVLAYGVEKNGVAPQEAYITAVTYGSDGARWIAVEGKGAVQVGAGTFDLPADGGNAVFAVTEAGAVQAPFCVLAGNVKVAGLEFLPNGDLIVAGAMGQTVTFGSGVAADGSVGEPFVARYAPNGTCTGVMDPLASVAATEVADLAVTPDGTIYLTGQSNGLTQFDADLTFAASTTHTDGYVLALHGLDPVWVRPMAGWMAPGAPGSALIQCFGVTALPDGGCAFSCFTREGGEIGGVRFGTGLGRDLVGAVARMSSDGDVEWVLTLTNGGVSRVASDAAGCLLVPGGGQGTLTFTDRDGTVVTKVPPSATTFDGFLLRLDPDGRLR